MAFGEVLKNLRKEKNITQKKLGEIFNLRRTTISGYETGRKEPDFGTLIKISDYFNVSVDYLLGTTQIKYDFKELRAAADHDTELADFINELIRRENLQTCSKYLLTFSNEELNKLIAVFKVLQDEC